MRRLLICLMAILILPILSAYGQITQNYQWTEIEKPYWTNAVDVAYGHDGDGQAWYRYLIGSNESTANIYWWDEGHSPWHEWDEIPNANKMISYRNEYLDMGNHAFFTAYGDRIYRTQYGGISWLPVPGSEALGNKQFSTIEVNYNASTANEAYNRCFVGCEMLANESSVYQRKYVNDQWQWSAVGQELNDRDVNDLEYEPEYGMLFAGTSNGLYGIQDDDQDWSYFQFDELPVPCVEAVEYHQTFWAATGGNSSQRKLYYTDDNWNSIQEIEVDGGSFNKEVIDIAAIPLNNGSDNFQSVYIATKTGLYLLNTVGMEEPSVTQFIDFQDCSGNFKTPFQTDFYIQSVDFYQSSRQATTRKILVGTKNSVYLLTETRSQDNSTITSITCEDKSEGTFQLYATSAAYPDNTGNPRFYVNSDKGIIKEYGGTDWSTKGLAFEAGQDRQTGTDISSDFQGENSDYILVSAKDATNGTVMFSSNGGQCWTKATPGSDEIINTVDLDRLPDSDTAWAAGTSNYIWKSTDNGLDWNSTIYFGNPSFNDILSDPSASLSSSVYACGSGIRSTYSVDGGRSWSTLENGLGSVTSLYQLGRESTAPGLYAATDLGFYKIYDITSTLAWSVRDYGIPTSSLGSVVVDPNNPFALLASTSPDISTPHIWASGDSGRSWIDLPLDEIPSNARIYKLVASQDANSGFVALTDKGVFAIGDIFKSGNMYSSETWGPGVIIVNGDVNIASSATLTILRPCTIYMVYDFDYTSSGYDHSKCEIRLYGNADLIAEGTSEDRIVFTSSKPTAKAKGDWTGITTNNQGGYPVIDLEYVTVEYADNGVFTAVGALADRIEIDHCDFNEMTTAGIDIYVPGYLEETPINNCNFINCGSYGIRIRDDSSPAYPEITISGNYMENCDYGIWYSGNSDANQRALNLANNKITLTAPSTQSQYGIYITDTMRPGRCPL
jgi:hypothetical protein